MFISIEGLDKWEVLLELYKSAKPPEQTSGNSVLVNAEAFYHRVKAGPKSTSVINGRFLRVDLSLDDFDSLEYDMVNGFGRAEKTIKELREKFSTVH